MVNATMGLTGGLGPYFVYSVSPSLDFYAYSEGRASDRGTPSAQVLLRAVTDADTHRRGRCPALVCASRS